MGADSSSELAQIFKALSADTRIRILEMLREQPLCVNALAARLNVTHSAVSQHLRVLKGAGLVLSNKQGYWAHYRVNEDALRQWAERVAQFLTS